MSDTKKSSRSSSGSFVVMGILLICAAAAYLSVAHYQSQVSSTDGAQLLYEGQVMATFAKSSGPSSVAEGMPATVTIKGYAEQKFPGTIKLIHVEDNGETTAIIQLANPPSDAQPPVPCRVTVDTTGLSIIKGG